MTTQSLQLKVNRLLSSNVSIASTGMITCLKGISEFIPEGGNDLKARRRLQHQLEAKDLEHCKDLLNRFSKVSAVLESASRALDELSDIVDQTAMKVEDAGKGSGSLVERASKLEAEKSAILGKSRVVHQLLEQFQLQPHHSQALEGAQVNEHMLTAMERVNSIRSNCHVLLESYQRVGIEMVDKLAKKQEKAYRTLFHWAQSQVPKFAEYSSSGANMNPLFFRGLRLLRERPAYFSHCLDMIADARRVAMIKRFIGALCRGGPNGQPRPIEIHAGDPVRYISDMFAWVHQALAMEREFLGGVVMESTGDSRQMPAKREGEEIKSSPVEEKNEKKAMGEAQLIGAVSRVLEGVARPLSVRVEQSLVFQPSITLSYNLLCILEFYYGTLRPLVDPAGSFLKAVKELVSKANSTFGKLIDSQAKQLGNAAAPYTHDLSPPQSIQSMIDQISNLLKIHEASLVPSAEKNHIFVPKLQKIVKAVKESAIASSEGLDGTNKTVFYLNVLCALEMALQTAETQVRSVKNAISTEVKSKLGDLVKSQSDEFLSRAGLLPILRTVNKWKQDGKSKNMESMGLSETALKRGIGEFYTYLVGASTLLTPEMDRVGDPWIRVTTREGVGLITSESYKSLYQTVLDAFGKEKGRSIMKHDPDQIKSLLDL